MWAATLRLVVHETAPSLLERSTTTEGNGSTTRLNFELLQFLNYYLPTQLHKILFSLACFFRETVVWEWCQKKNEKALNFG